MTWMSLYTCIKTDQLLNILSSQNTKRSSNLQYFYMAKTVNCGMLMLMDHGAQREV